MYDKFLAACILIQRATKLRFLWATTFS